MNKTRILGGLAAIVLASTGILEFRPNITKKKETTSTKIPGTVSITVDPLKVGEFYAERYGIPKEITLGTITVESKGIHFNKKGEPIEGNDGERGIIQIKRDFVEDIIKALSDGYLKADGTNWNDVVNMPAENIRVGALAHRFTLRKLRDAGLQTGNIEPLTILGYNAGWPTAVIRANESKSFRKVIESFNKTKRNGYLRYVASVIGYGRNLAADLHPTIHGKIKITSDFGMRNHPKLKKKRKHEGIDIKAKEGTAIMSPDNLTVEDRGLNSSRGHYINLKTETKYGFYIRYKFNHCSKINARKGEKVRRGQVIANVGKTGLVTGAHLHVEVSSVYSPRGGNEIETTLNPKHALSLKRPKPIRFIFDKDDAIDFVNFSYRNGRSYADKNRCNESYAHLDNVIQSGNLTTLADDAALIAGDCFRRINRSNEAKQAYDRGIAFNGDMKLELEKRVKL